MPQVSLYLEEEALSVARRNARIEGVSLSKYVSRSLVKSAASGWPEGYWDLFGSIDDDTFGYPEDIPFSQIETQIGFS